MNAKKGFSLIELLVVVTIIGIIAVVAVPLYQRYLETARLFASSNALLSIANQAITFAQQKGYFPRPPDLNLTETSPGSGDVSDSAASAIMPHYLLSSPYTLMEIKSYAAYAPGGSSCAINNNNGIGFVDADIDPAQLGMPSNIVVVGLECDYWMYNNVFEKLCYYGYLKNDSTFGSDNILPGWINKYAPGGAAQITAIESGSPSQCFT